MPQPRFGGWSSYREWADHGFIPRQEQPLRPPARHAKHAAGAAEREQQPGQETESEVADKQQAAAQLGTHTPGWLLMYGASTRQFWAYPTSPRAPRGLILAAATPGRLYELIQQAEAQFRLA